MRILIVEGNTPELMARMHAIGRPLAWQTWQTAIRLHKSDVEISVVYPYSVEHGDLHEPLDTFDGFVFTGSGVSWNAMDERASSFIDVIEPMLLSGKPVLGACWGLQVASVALGGEVAANPKGSEIGLAHVTLNEAGLAHAVFAGSAAQFATPTWHRDHVTRLPHGAVLLASSDVTHVQALAVQAGGVDFVGFQYHPEAELHDFRRGFKAYGALPDSVAVIADFPDNPPLEVTDPKRRTHTIGNWLRHVEARRGTTAAPPARGLIASG
jgi:GMP synthase (glutamine-hydrolysing)